MSDTPFVRGEWSSASNAAADALCMGRLAAQRGLTDTTSEDASHGNLIHAALAKQNPAGLDFAQTETYEACQAIFERELRKIFGANYDRATVWREVRLHVRVPALPDPRSGKPTAFYPHSGQLDAFVIVDRSAVVVEFKSLPGDLPVAAKNEQIRDQIVLLARQPQYPLNEIVGLVIQPLVTHSPEPVLYTQADIAEAEKRMFARVIASNAPNAPRVAGEVQCKFCLAKEKCVEYSRWSGALIPASDSVPMVRDARRLAFQTPMEQWTPEQCAVVAEILAPAQKTLDDYKEFIKARLTADANAVPGWTLKPGAIKEKVTDAQACWERFLAAGGKPEQFMGAVSVAKGKLKESLAAATGLKGVKLKEQLDTLLIGIVEQNQNQPSLVKISE